MRSKLSFLLGVIALASLPATGVAATNAERLSSGIYRIEYAKLGGWTILRFAKDSAGHDVIHCAAVKMIASEQGLRFGFDAAANEFTYGFMGAGSAVSQERPVTFWFDDDRANGTSSNAVLYKEIDDSEWLGRVQSAKEPGFETPFLAHKKFSVRYQLEGRQHTESFSLTGLNTALPKLLECSRGR